MSKRSGRKQNNEVADLSEISFQASGRKEVKDVATLIKSLLKKYEGQLRAPTSLQLIPDVDAAVEKLASRHGVRKWEVVNAACVLLIELDKKRSR